MTRPFVSGLILGAGGSTRLGQPKQLLSFRGTTLLGWVVGEAEGATALDEVVVVLGRAAEEIRRRVAFVAPRSGAVASGVGAVRRAKKISNVVPLPGLLWTSILAPFCLTAP